VASLWKSAENPRIFKLIKIIIDAYRFYNVAPCSLVGIVRRFGWTYFRCRQNRRALIHVENGSIMFFRSVSRFMPDHTAWQPTRGESSQWPLWEPLMSRSKYWQADSHFLYVCLKIMHEFDKSNLYLTEQSVRLTLRRHGNWQGRYGSNATIHIFNCSSRCRCVAIFVLLPGFHCNEADFDLQPIPNVVPKRKIPFPDGKQLPFAQNIACLCSPADELTEWIS